MEITKDNYFGVVAKCKYGDIGVIYSYGINSGYYKGIKLDGKHWLSKQPTFVASNIEQYMETKYE